MVTLCVREQASKIVRKEEVRNLVKKLLNKRIKKMYERFTGSLLALLYTAQISYTESMNAAYN